MLALLLGLGALNAFNLQFLNPDSPRQALVFITLSTVAFLLFLGVLVLLVRNVIKLYADQRTRVLGTRLRTRMLWGAVLVSLVPPLLEWRRHRRSAPTGDDLERLLSLSIDELCLLPGIGLAKAAIIQAALELGLRNIKRAIIIVPNDTAVPPG